MTALERVTIYIDGAYLAVVLRDTYQRARIDFSKLAHKLTGDGDLVRVYYYNSLPEPGSEASEKNAKMKKFFHAINLLPYYKVVVGNVEQRGEDASNGRPLYQQKGVDIAIAVDMLTHAMRGLSTRQILVTGDSDFVPVIEAVKETGVRVTLWHGYNANDRLLSVADSVKFLDAKLISRARHKGIEGD